MDTQSTLYLIITIFFLAVAVFCLVQGMVGIGIGLGAFGPLGLLARIGGKKKG